MDNVPKSNQIEKAVAAEKAQKELVIKEAKAKELSDKAVAKLLLQLATGIQRNWLNCKNHLGNFAYSATFPSAKAAYTQSKMNW